MKFLAVECAETTNAEIFTFVELVHRVAMGLSQVVRLQLAAFV
jgi:hypothetical protein